MLNLIHSFVIIAHVATLRLTVERKLAIEDEAPPKILSWSADCWYVVSKKCARAELRISAYTVNSLIANGSLLVAMANKKN